MKRLYLLPILVFALFACNKPDSEPMQSLVGLWHFDAVISAQNLDLTAHYDSTRLEIDAEDIRLYKTFVTPDEGLVDSLIAEGIYDSYWGMVTEYPDPEYPDSSIQVQYQKINFAWATPPPYPYTTAFDDWHLVKKEPGELHIRNAAKVNFYLVP